ncbi:MAG TPA: hypothetical protein EYG69_00300 [Campylobacterales bacterium]|nr:hypothetical protein [Campylobacterales bacterium]
MLCILLINDNKIVSRLLQLSSKKSGFDMEESGIFSPQKESYNLIFIDSDKYNPELVDKIKTNLTYDKLVFIGTNQVKKPAEFELLLEKPFLPADFTSLIESNFITESEESKDDNNLEDSDDKEFEFNEELHSFDNELDSTPEKLSQIIDDIDEEIVDDLDIDENEMEINDDLLNFDDEDIEESEIDEELPNIDNELEEDSEENKIDKLEDLLEETVDETTKISDNLEIDIETKEETIVEKEDGDELLSLDEDKLKKVIEPELVENVEIVDNNKDIEPFLETKKEDELDNNQKNLEDIVKEQLKEIITANLLKDVLKDMQINITFSSKD